MFRIMPVGRTPQAKAAETRVILIALNEFLSGRKLQPCVPKLAYGVRKKQECAPGLSDELVAFIQERIHSHRAATGWSARLDESVSVIKELDKLCEKPLKQDDPESFRVLAERHGIEVIKVRGLRGNSCPGAGLSDAPPTAAAACAVPPPEPTPEPTQTRAVATEADVQAARVAQITQLAAVLNASGDAIAELGMQLSPSAIAALVAGHAAAHGSLAAAAELLSREHRRQLAPPPPPPPPPPERRSIETQTEPAAPAETAREAAGVMPLAELPSLLDLIGTRLLGAAEALCLRRCVVAIMRIHAFNAEHSKDGRKQPNFVRSLLECYGADERERLPLGHFLPTLIYYATRICDDAHFGRTLSGRISHFNEDGADRIYVEAWRDLKDHAGHVAINFLRGPLMSNILKHGGGSKGQFDISKLPLEERGERCMLGSAVPSVQALNKGVKACDKMERGGVSAPLKRGIADLGRAMHTRLCELTGEQLEVLDTQRVTEELLATGYKPLDVAAAQRAFHGERRARMHIPKKPKVGQEDVWWAQPIALDEPGVEQNVQERTQGEP